MGIAATAARDVIHYAGVEFGHHHSVGTMQLWEHIGQVGTMSFEHGGFLGVGRSTTRPFPVSVAKLFEIPGLKGDAPFESALEAARAVTGHHMPDLPPAVDRALVRVGNEWKGATLSDEHWMQRWPSIVNGYATEQIRRPSTDFLDAAKVHAVTFTPASHTPETALVKPNEMFALLGNKQWVDMRPAHAGGTPTVHGF